MISFNSFKRWEKELYKNEGYFKDFSNIGNSGFYLMNYLIEIFLWVKKVNNLLEKSLGLSLFIVQVKILQI